MSTTYIFIDESGKPEIYSSKGINLVEKGQASKFLVLCAVRTNDQLSLQQKIMDFKSNLLKDVSLTERFSSAYTLDAFHAKNDYPEIKEKFYMFINELDIKVDVIIVEKLKCYLPLQQKPGKMYGVMAGQLLKNLCHHTDETEIIFSRKDSNLRLRQELNIEVERVRLEYLQSHQKLNTNIKLQYFHNPHYSHGGLQIADYIAYSVFQVYERKDTHWYDLISKKIGKIHDICNQKYFTKSNPLKLSV